MQIVSASPSIILLHISCCTYIMKIQQSFLINLCLLQTYSIFLYEVMLWKFYFSFFITYEFHVKVNNVWAMQQQTAEPFSFQIFRWKIRLWQVCFCSVLEKIFYFLLCVNVLQNSNYRKNNLITINNKFVSLAYMRFIR